MTDGLDAADLSILYETARAFIGLGTAEESLRHALLSVMGSCGARFAIYLERAPQRRFIPRASRGDAPEGDLTLRLAPSAERALADEPGPHRPGDAGWLDARTKSLLKRAGVDRLVAVNRKGSLGGLLAIGPRMLGERYTGREEKLIAAIAGMTGQALLVGEPPASSAGRRPVRRTSAAAALQERHPALREIQGDGPAAIALLEEIVALADFDQPVLLVGETGTGKELVARALHDLGPHAAEPFEAINCAAIPPELMPSALFGHERGAFTGAESTARGAFERAGAGTLFLDEIGDMPFATQATLLRVLQEKQFRRVGGEKLIPARARIISATNRDLREAARAGTFRPDLFYRIQMVGIRIPPLRERQEDIPRLVEHLLARHRAGRSVRVSAGFIAELGRRSLPGNVRELEGLVLTALVRAGRDGTLRPEHLPAEAGTAEPAGAAAIDRARGPAGIPARRAVDSEAPDSPPTYDNMEREYIRSVLRLTGGNRKQAAALMGIPRTTLNARLRKLDLEGKV